MAKQKWAPKTAESTLHTLRDELKYINALVSYPVLLAQYENSLNQRKHWELVNREAVREYLRSEARRRAAYLKMIAAWLERALRGYKANP